METWHRPFAYITGSLVFGLLIIVFTNSFLGYVNDPGWIGYAALIAYGLVFVNISYVINMRFTKKNKRPSNISYLMAALLILPALVWVYTKNTGLATSRIVFTLTIVFAVFLGAWYGIKAGVRKRAGYLHQLREEQDDLPEDLQRRHDKLNKN